MASIGRALFLAHVPITIVLMVWTWIGRAIFVDIGWYMVFLPLLGGIVIPMFALQAALNHATPLRPKQFTAGQSFGHLAMWLAIIVFSVCLVDGSDHPVSYGSIFTHATGSTDELSNLIAFIALVAALVCSLACIALAWLAKRKAPRPVVHQWPRYYYPGQAQPYPARPYPGQPQPGPPPGWAPQQDPPPRP